MVTIKVSAMNDNSLIILPQSTTSEAKTPPLATVTVRKERNQRLQLYTSLFGQDKNNVCKETGLHLGSSLNYSLYTFLHLRDINWVLAMIDIDEKDEWSQKYGQQGAKRKMYQIATVLKNFCLNDPRKLKGFKCNDLIDENESTCQLFAVLMCCHPKLDKAEKYVSKLIKKIKEQTNETVSVGIAKMNEWETFDEWKHRGFKNMKIANDRNTIETEEKAASSLFYSDISVKYINPKQGHLSYGKGDEKQQQEHKTQRPLMNLGTQEEFDAKMQEISNNEDYEWIVAMMVIDDFEEFLFLNNGDKQVVSKRVHQVEQEIYHLFDIYGNGTNKNEMKYFAYKLSAGSGCGGTGIFGLVLYDSKDVNKCFVPAHEILETLKEEINMKYKFTVSIGSSRLVEDDLGMMDDWYERVKNNLEQAKRSGHNQICFGNTNVNEDSEIAESKADGSNALNVDDDAIQEQSLQEIQKYGFAAAANLENVNILVNNGKLVNENDADIKYDYDPTETLAINSITKVTYSQIFLEVAKFIHDNNNTNKPYLEYPKLYLNSNKPKCRDKTNCKQCYHSSETNSNSNSNNNNIFSLCATKRREIANQLFDIAQERQCVTDSLSAITRQLFVSDKVLLNDSSKYELNDNWFVNLYSFLKWQQELTNKLLRDLTHFEKDESKKAKSTPTAMVNFDLFLSLYSYLDELIEYLVLYYCGFDSHSWIAVFYPFIEAAIGTSQCKILFAESRTSSKQMLAICQGVLDMDRNIQSKQQPQLANRCLQEMHAVTIFKRILGGIYGFGDTSVMKFKFDPFDLAHKIYCKLNETVYNIKTQLVIDEMTGSSRNARTSSNTKQLLNEETKDDWSIDESSTRIFRMETPSFIRLFAINRIIDKYTQKMSIELSNVFEDNPQIKSQATDIVTRLRTCGIKEYMDKYYDETKQANIIETIFSKIIFIKFGKEYSKWIGFGEVNNTNDNHYQTLVFHSKDLMCMIFQYLDYGTKFDGDLVSCSLVNSYWLYHAWNINSVYFINLSSLIEGMALNSSFNYFSHENNLRRMWQRFVNAKHVCLYIDFTFDDNQIAMEQVQRRLSMLRQVEILDIASIHRDQSALSILKSIVLGCKESIKNCSIKITTGKENQLSPLILPNVRFVTVGDLFFYRTWSNNCQRLVLILENMSQLWCQFVISHCDCSNIKSLKLCLVTDKDNINTPDSKIIIDRTVLQQFASKFIGIRRLEIVLHTQYDRNVLLIWQFLKPLIDKNNGKVQVFIDDKHKLTKNEAVFLKDTISAKQDEFNPFWFKRIKQRGVMTGQRINNWVIGGVIAKGGFGVVHVATHVERRVKAAIKIIRINEKTRDRDEQMTKREIDALTRANHDKIINLLNVCNVRQKQQSMKILVFEYMKNGDLHQYLKYNKRFDLPICKRFFDQIVSGLCYLHNKLRIAHRDLNPSNLLLDDQFNIKIADFGLCKFCVTDVNGKDKNESKTSQVESNQLLKHSLGGGHVGYMAPEMCSKGASKIYLTNENERLSCDVFSLGIILWKMLMGSHSEPFRVQRTDLEHEDDSFNTTTTDDTDVYYEHYEMIDRKQYDLWWKQFENEIPYYYDNDVKNLFVRMFDTSPKTRIKINDIPQHQWYKKIDGKYRNADFETEMETMWLRKEILRNTHGP